MVDLAYWRAKYIGLGDQRPARRRCVSYRALAAHLATVPLDATRDVILARLATFEADDPDFWTGLLSQMADLPADADWYQTMQQLCYWLKQENILFVEALMMDWILADV